MNAVNLEESLRPPVSPHTNVALDATKRLAVSSTSNFARLARERKIINRRRLY